MVLPALSVERKVTVPLARADMADLLAGCPPDEAPVADHEVVRHLDVEQLAGFYAVANLGLCTAIASAAAATTRWRTRPLVSVLK